MWVLRFLGCVLVGVESLKCMCGCQRLVGCGFTKACVCGGVKGLCVGV